MYWYSMPISYKIVRRLTYLLLAINSMFEFNSLPCQWFRLVKNTLLQHRITSRVALASWTGVTGVLCSVFICLGFCKKIDIYKIHLKLGSYKAEEPFCGFYNYRYTQHVALILSLRYLNGLTSFFTCMIFIGNHELWRYFCVDCASVSTLWNVNVKININR